MNITNAIFAKHVSMACGAAPIIIYPQRRPFVRNSAISIELSNAILKTSYR